LIDRALDLVHVGDQPVHRHHVIGPLDAGFIAHRHRRHNVPVAVGQDDRALYLRVVVFPVGAEGLLAEISSPGAGRVAHLGCQIKAQHHAEVQALRGDDFEHDLGVPAAVVQSQMLPVCLQDQKVLFDLGVGGVHAGPGTLVLPVTRVTDCVAVRDRRLGSPVGPPS
jgi:hypothetical protein